MPTITKATVTQKIEVSYVCSNCGTPNKNRTTLVVEESSSEAAVAGMKHLLVELIRGSGAKRYMRANLNCTCESCGNVEPWAKKDYSKNWVWTLLLALLTSFVPLLIRDFDSGLTPYLENPLDFLWLLPPVLLQAYFTASSYSIQKKISELPPESLPTIKLLRSDAYDEYNIMARVHQKLHNQ